LKYLWFDPGVEGKQFGDLFQLALPGKMTVKEAKTAIFEHFNQLPEETKTKITWTISKPEQIRLRDMAGTAPKRIFLDTETIKDLGKGYVYSVPEVAVQNLPEGQTENKKDRDDIIFFLQEFHPETWSLGDRVEFCTNDDEVLTIFRDRIADKTKTKKIGLVSGGDWSGPKILSIPRLSWNVPPSSVEAIEALNTRVFGGKVRSLGISDGDLIIFRNMEIPLVELSDEQKKKNETRR